MANALIHVVHPFPPLYDEHSQILILGSFPSVKSREQRFFYGHPQNRFWPLIARLYGEDTPGSIEEKKALLHRHRIALWDSIYSCDIVGSSDSSVRNAEPTDLRHILAAAPIRQIYCNGQASFRTFARYQEQTLGRSAIALPSTSPANAAWTLDRLAEAWQIIL